MFKMIGEDLQNVVCSMVKGARKARIGEDKNVYIKTDSDRVSFCFDGKNLQVIKEVESEITNIDEVATTIFELENKVMALPKDEIISFVKVGELLHLKWGRSSKIICETIEEKTPYIEIPEVVESIIWKEGTLHFIGNNFYPFCAKINSSTANRSPSLLGVNMSVNPGNLDVFARSSDGKKAISLKTEGCQWFSDLKQSIPIESIKGLSEIMQKDEEVRIGVNESKTLLVFKSGLITAVSRLLTGVFPNLEAKYGNEENNITKWTFDRMEIIELCRRVKKLSPRNPVMNVKVDGPRTKAEVPHILTQKIGAVKEGEIFDFSVHPEYLEAAASLIRTEEIQLFFTDKNSAITIVGNGSDQFRFLITQLRR